MNCPFRRRFRLLRHEEILFLVGGNSRLSKKGKKYGHPSPLWARISAMSSNTVSGLAAVQKSPMASPASYKCARSGRRTHNLRTFARWVMGVMRHYFMRPLAAMALASSMESW